MKKSNLGRALFVGLFVGITSFIREFFFPNMNSLLSIFLIMVAALIGYWIGNKILIKRENERNGKTTI